MYGNPSRSPRHEPHLSRVQIQCAECHDAKFEEARAFHELAAFFAGQLIQHKDYPTPRHALRHREPGRRPVLHADKKDPTHLIPMQPRFLTGENVSIDADDAERREALAASLPTRKIRVRPLLRHRSDRADGLGFYPTVIDVGSFGQPRHKETLELLEKRGRQRLRSEVADAHGRADAGTSAHAAPDSSASPRRRSAPCGCGRASVDALQQALGFDENDKNIPAPAPLRPRRAAAHRPAQHGLPGVQGEPVHAGPGRGGTIPQRFYDEQHPRPGLHVAKGKTLWRLPTGQTNEQIVAGCTSGAARKPTNEEQATCRRYIEKVGDRKERWKHPGRGEFDEFLIKK